MCVAVSQSCKQVLSHEETRSLMAWISSGELRPGEGADAGPCTNCAKVVAGISHNTSTQPSRDARMIAKPSFRGLQTSAQSGQMHQHNRHNHLEVPGTRAGIIMR